MQIELCYSLHIVPKSIAISSVVEISLFVSAENDDPPWMDYQRVTETGLTILYFLGLRLGSSFRARLSTIGSNLSNGSCFYPSDRFSLEPTNMIELNMCSHERIPDREQRVNNYEKTVINRYRNL